MKQESMLATVDLSGTRPTIHNATIEFDERGFIGLEETGKLVIQDVTITSNG